MATATIDDTVDALHRLGAAAAHVGAGSLDRAGCEQVIAAVAAARRRLDACEVRIARRLGEIADADPIAPPPADVLAVAGRADARTAERTTARAATLDDVPQLAARLDDGEVSGEQLDVVGGVLRRFSAERRAQFGEQHGEALARAATTSTPSDLRDLAVTLAQRFERASEARARFDAQRRANRLRMWADRVTGMVRLSGSIDPEHGQALIARLRDEIEARFHSGVPDTAPDDPFERQDHLRALALVALVLGGPAERATTADGAREREQFAASPSAPASGRAVSGVASRRRPETITVIDLRTLVAGWHERSFVDLGTDGLELPVEAIVRRALTGEIVPVFVDPHGVVTQVGDPPQPLDLGRTSRLANRAQRRALRVMYPRCAIPGCTVGFDHCEPHHITWWRHGGRTDLANLLPLCTKHHHLVHDDGWVLSMSPDRALTVHRPDGSVQRCRPPGAERRR